MILLSTCILQWLGLPSMTCEGTSTRRLSSLSQIHICSNCFSSPKIMQSLQVHSSAASIWLLSILLGTCAVLGCSFQKQWDLSGLRTLFRCYLVNMSLTMHVSHWSS